MGILPRKYIAILLFVLCVVVLPFYSEAQADSVKESKVKAAFVINFARFISWPEEAFASKTAPLVICTVGLAADDPAFSGIETKKIKDRQIVVKKIRSLDELSEQCHVLYVTDVSNKKLQTYLNSSDNVPLVSIGEADGFAHRGGTIEFVKVNDRLSFKINNTNAKKRQLRINASLLNLAVEVY